MDEIRGPWWVVDEQTLLAMLRAVESGESPDMVYAQAFANATQAMPR